jgi:hypothetical protein
VVGVVEHIENVLFPRFVGESHPLLLGLDQHRGKLILGVHVGETLGQLFFLLLFLGPGVNRKSEVIFPISVDSIGVHLVSELVHLVLVEI